MADFPLPTLAAKLEHVRHSVVHGRGFYLLRGGPARKNCKAWMALNTDCPPACCQEPACLPSCSLASLCECKTDNSLLPRHPATAPQSEPYLMTLVGLPGFPVDQLSRQETVAAFYGVGLYWGAARSQNAKGHVVSAGPAGQGRTQGGEGHWPWGGTASGSRPGR